MKFQFIKKVLNLLRSLTIPKEELKMAKTDVVAAALAAIQAGETQVLSDTLSSVYDQALAAAGSAPGSFTQSDIDAAVAAAQAVDAKALSDAQAQGASALAALQASLDQMTQKEQLEEKAVADVSAKIDQVQASFDAIKALLSPAPVVPA